MTEPGAAASSERPVPEADFLTLVASLGAQASIHLGLVAHPIAKKVSKDMKQARYVIDLLTVLEKKTKGNLTAEEQNVLSQILTDLRLRFVQASPG